MPYVVEAYPEGNMAHLSAESGLYCRVFTEGLFGVEPAGLKRFRLCPRLPKDWGGMSLRRVKAFGQDFDIEVSRQNRQLKIDIIKDGKVFLSETTLEGDSLLVVFP